MKKICKGCEQNKPLEDFGKMKTTKDGLKTRCKICLRSENRKYYAENKEVSKLYYEVNKEKLSTSAKERYNKNKEKILSHNKEYRTENIEKIKRSRKIYRDTNKEEISMKKKLYRDNNQGRLKELREINKEKIILNRKSESGKLVRNIAEAKRRAKKLLGTIDNTDHENYLINCLYEFSLFKSKHTGIKHHVDHVKPLSKGGLHNPFNMQLLTASENLHKSNTF